MKTCKQLLSSMVLGSGLMLAASSVWAQTPVPVGIAVEASAQAAIVEAITAFNGSQATYTVSITAAGSSGALRNTILTALNLDATTVDLFLAANTGDPFYLFANHGIPSTGTGRVVVPQEYAEGELLFWSNGAINIDDTYTPAPGDTFGICEPPVGPYGMAAAQVLWNQWGIPFFDSPPVYEYMCVDAVDNAIIAGAPPSPPASPASVKAGFVPTALHCVAGEVDLSSFPGASGWVIPVGPSTYDRPIHGAVVILDPSKNYGGTYPADGALAFLEFLRSEDGQEILWEHCLELKYPEL